MKPAAAGVEPGPDVTNYIPRALAAWCGRRLESPIWAAGGTMPTIWQWRSGIDVAHADPERTSMIPLILAIDPATSTGYAVGEVARRASVRESGTVALGTSSAGERYAHLWALMEMLRAKHQPIAAVAFERAFHRGGPATRYHHGYVAVIEMWAYRVGTRTISATAGQIKGASGGGGRAEKDSMVWRARAYFGIDVTTDDQADSLWLYELARAQLWEAHPAAPTFTKEDAWRKGTATRTAAPGATPRT